MLKHDSAMNRMNRKLHPEHRRRLFVVSLIIGLTVALAFANVRWTIAQGPQPQTPAAALGTGFTYQGQLKKNNTPINDNTCSMTFSLWDSSSSGAQVGGIQTIVPVTVTNGLFTVVLNGGSQFGASAFDGSDRWLQAAVQCAGDGSAVTLSRQRLSATPYALFSAAPWVSSGSNLTYNAGNVGIGTTSPANKLMVDLGPSAPVDTGITIQGNTSTFGDLGLRIKNTGTGGIDWYIDSTNNNSGYGGSLLAFVPGPPASPVMVLRSSGNVGIGTADPTSRLKVVGPDTDGNTIAFRVEDSNGQYGLLVRDNRTIQIGALDGFASTGACYTGFYGFAACSSAAEYVPTIDDGVGYAEAADLVSIAPSVKNPYDDEHSPFVVTKAAKPCDDNLLGFIVNPESGADGKKLNEHYLPLAIYGYFPAKVTLENGAIKRGDALTSSSKAGYGMKATQACKIIGYALEDADQEGTIQVFANHSENAAPEVAALRAQVKLQAEQIAAQQNQLDALSTRLAALEQSAKSGGAPTLASR